MKVAMIFAIDNRESESVVSPFKAQRFADGLRVHCVEPAIITVGADRTGSDARYRERAAPLDCPVGRLAEAIAVERPQLVQTFGPEHRAAQIWAIAADYAPVAHCVSSWRTRRGASGFSPIGMRTKCASRNVSGLIGTSRSTVGELMDRGYFRNVQFSVITPPPIDRPGRPTHSSDEDRPVEPTFGVYDPNGGRDVLAFLDHVVALTGWRDGVKIRVATKNLAPGFARIAFDTAGDIDVFLSSINVLVVPIYDDSIAPVLAAAWQSTIPVIVPDASGAAELIGYGRHGLMFPSGSAYHLANLLNVVRQGWEQTPVVVADSSAALTRVDPAKIASTYAAFFQRIGATAAGLAQASLQFAPGVHAP